MLLNQDASHTLKIIKIIYNAIMEIYTVKDDTGGIYPKAFIAKKDIRDAVVGGKIVQVDYGMESVEAFLDTEAGKGLKLCHCILKEIIK